MRYERFLMFSTACSGIRTCAVVYVICLTPAGALGTRTAGSRLPASRKGYTPLRRHSSWNRSCISASSSGRSSARS